MRRARSGLHICLFFALLLALLGGSTGGTGLRSGHWSQGAEATYAYVVSVQEPDPMPRTCLLQSTSIGPEISFRLCAPTVLHADTGGGLLQSKPQPPPEAHRVLSASQALIATFPCRCRTPDDVCFLPSTEPAHRLQKLVVSHHFSRPPPTLLWFI